MKGPGAVGEPLEVRWNTEARGCRAGAFIPCAPGLAHFGQIELLGKEMVQQLTTGGWALKPLGRGHFKVFGGSCSLGSPSHLCIGEPPICPSARTDAISLPPHQA